MKTLSPNPTPEKTVFHAGPDGRIVKAPRTQAIKPGWHVATEVEIKALADADACFD